MMLLIQPEEDVRTKIDDVAEHQLHGYSFNIWYLNASVAFPAQQMNNGDAWTYVLPKQSSVKHEKPAPVDQNWIALNSVQYYHADEGMILRLHVNENICSMAVIASR